MNIPVSTVPAGSTAGAMVVIELIMVLAREAQQLSDLEVRNRVFT